MGQRGYNRTRWTRVKPRTVKYRVLALLLKGVNTGHLPEWLGIQAFWNALRSLEIHNGYIVWLKPLEEQSVCWDGRKSRRYTFCKITGRLAWTGGVAEDYTVPKDDTQKHAAQEEL